MKTLIALACVAVFSFPLGVCAADLAADLAQCAKVTDSIKRLECFDGLVKKSTVKETQAPSDTAWHVDRSKSKLDDSETVVLSTDALEAIPGPLQVKKVRPALIIRCSEGETDLFVSWGMFIGSRSVEVTERIDSEKAVTASWGLSTDGKATFKDGPVPYIKQLMGHKKLLLQVTPFNENPRLVEFNITGIDEAIKPVQEACRWK